MASRINLLSHTQKKTQEQGVRRIRSKLETTSVCVLWLVLILSMIVTVYSWVQYRTDQRKLTSLVLDLVSEDAQPSSAMRTLLHFMETEVGHDRGESYFLHPALGFMRPTAR